MSKLDKFQSEQYSSQQPDLTNKLSFLKQKIEGVEKETKEAIEIFQKSPTPENATTAIASLAKDNEILEHEKNEIIETINGIILTKYNFNNCPDDYQALKKEVKILAGINQYSFLLMAQRLKKIRDEKLYEADGYQDWNEFINNELPIARASAYNYIMLLECFGVQTFGRLDGGVGISKLIPFISVINNIDQETEKNDLIQKLLEDIKTKSARELADEARDLKVKLRISKAPDNKATTVINKDFDRLYKAIHKIGYDKNVIQLMINELQRLL